MIDIIFWFLVYLTGLFLFSCLWFKLVKINFYKDVQFHDEFLISLYPLTFICLIFYGFSKFSTYLGFKFYKVLRGKLWVIFFHFKQLINK
jgi:hypothetical protein